MQKILVPVDFSEGTLNTVKYSLSIAGDRETNIHLFHIYYDRIMVPDAGFPEDIDGDYFMNAELMESLRKQSEKNLKDLSKQVEQLIPEAMKAIITLSTSLNGGDPQWEIEEAIEALNPDLVIMGTHGSGKKEFLEGRMAKKIMEKAKRPVLAVPASETDFRLKNILYATRFSDTDEENVRRIFKLFSPKALKIFVTCFALDDDSSAESKRMEAVKNRFEKERLQERVQFSLVKTGQKEDALHSFVTFNDIDMIAFLSHKKNIFKGLFSKELHKKDFFKLGLPMLALHENVS